MGKKILFIFSIAFLLSAAFISRTVKNPPASARSKPISCSDPSINITKATCPYPVQEPGGKPYCKDGYLCHISFNECKYSGNNHCFFDEEHFCSKNPKDECQKKRRPTPTPKPSHTPTPTPTPTSTPTPTPTATPTPTSTPTPTPTNTPGPTPTPTPPQVLGVTAPPVLPKTGLLGSSLALLTALEALGIYLIKRSRLP